MPVVHVSTCSDSDGAKVKSARWGVTSCEGALAQLLLQMAIAASLPFALKCFKDEPCRRAYQEKSGRTYAA
jgi:hypothetical protein